MYIIEIPKYRNRVQFVYDILDKLVENFIEYDFINCTDSPIDELSYIKSNGVYYRKIQRQNIAELINESNYLNAYRADNLDKIGCNLKDYIEMCLLYELGEIKVIHKDNNCKPLKFENALNSLASLIVCPDGLDEIHIIGTDCLVQKIVSIIEN